MLLEHVEDEATLGLGVAAESLRRPVGVVVDARNRGIAMQASVGMVDEDAQAVKLLGRGGEPEVRDDLAHRQRLAEVLAVVSLAARGGGEASRLLQLFLQSILAFLSRSRQDRSQQKRNRKWVGGLPRARRVGWRPRSGAAS